MVLLGEGAISFDPIKLEWSLLAGIWGGYFDFGFTRFVDWFTELVYTGCNRRTFYYYEH